MWAWESGRLRFYIDNETTPSIDIFLRELASVGKRDAVGDTATIGAFGTPLFGKTAKSGGAYSTMRIPFGSSIKVTLQNADTASHNGIYWFIIRGIESLPVTLGGELTLPDQARLHVARNAAVLLQPQELITLVSAPAGTAGALVNVFLDNNSTDPNYLEACFRFTADGAADPTFLSSGTEDFFLSASYFDEGPFQNSQSGVTYAGGRGDFAMYKTHESRDYVLWSDGALLQWRNNEHSSGPTACPTTWPWVPSSEDAATPPLGTGPLTTDTLVFYYSWPSTGLTFGGKAL